MSLKPIIRNIRASGMTVKGWALKRGFEYQTVIKVLNGYTGKRRIGITKDILDALKEDGFFLEDAA